MKEMKTFDEILIETHDSISRGEMMGKENKLSFRDIERLAAKEYAKQWVEYSHKMQLRPIEMIKKEIDAQ